MSPSAVKNNINMMLQVSTNDKIREQQTHPAVLHYPSEIISRSGSDTDNTSIRNITNVINCVDFDISTSSSASCPLFSLNESQDTTASSENRNLPLLHPTTSTRISRIVSRESISSRKDDHVVSKANIPISSYNNQNLSSMLFNRSGSSFVEKIIRTINERCVQQQQQQKDDEKVLSPITELQILQQWASDSFYSVVILRRMGIEATLNAMTTFTFDMDLVMIGCIILDKLCTSSEKNIIRINENHGIQIIFNILDNYPQISESIQSAALRVAHCCLLLGGEEQSKITICEPQDTNKTGSCMTYSQLLSPFI